MFCSNTPWDIVMVVNVSGWVQSKVPHGIKKRFGLSFESEDAGEVFLILTV